MKKYSSPLLEDKKSKSKTLKSQLPMNLVFNIPKKYKIPRIIKKIYPYMSEEDYQNEVDNDYFLNK